MTTSFVFSILSLEAAASLADSIKRRGKAFDRDVQSLCLTAIGYANTHGDVTIANRILPAIPAGSRKQAIVNLLEGLGCLKYDAKSKMFNHTKREDVLRDPVAIVEALAHRNNFWTNYTPEPTIVSNLDALEAVHKLVKRLQSAADKGTVIDSPEVFARLVEMTAEVEGSDAE